MDFVLIDALDQQDSDYDRMLGRCRSNARAHCPLCGRFARFVSGRTVYLGYGSEYRVLVRCATHGEQEVY